MGKFAVKLTPAGGDGILTSNRLGRAPPPTSADLKF
jgi:hypothetical protein